MTEYYFLATALPELDLEVPPELSLNDLKALFKNNLTEEDQLKLKTVFRYYDLRNIKAFWTKKQLDLFGNLDENELEDALLVRGVFPDYVYDFIEAYDSHQDRIKNFPALVSAYFSNEIAKSTGFLHTYLTFEREWRLVLVGFRAKKTNRDVTVELQWEDPHDEIVAQILAQKDAKTYEPPARYESLKSLFEEYGDDPIALHQALLQYRFYRIQELLGVDLFSFDRILGYLVQYIIVSKWLELDKRKGMEQVENIMKGES